MNIQLLHADTVLEVDNCNVVFTSSHQIIQRLEVYRHLYEGSVQKKLRFLFFL